MKVPASFARLFTSFLAASLLALLMGTAYAIHAQEATETPTPAPPNPRFAEYMEDLTHGHAMELTITPEGHTLEPVS